MNWPELLAHEGFKVLDMLQDVVRPSGAAVRTTRCPIRIDGARPASTLASPKIGEHNAWVERTYLTDEGDARHEQAA